MAKVTLDTMYLVVLRTNLDEVPLLLTPDRHAAKIFAKTVSVKDLFKIVERNVRIMKIDAAGWINLTIFRFKGGRFMSMDIVRDVESPSECGELSAVIAGEKLAEKGINPANS